MKCQVRDSVLLIKFKELLQSVNIHAIYFLDFSKAFDTVDHQILI